MTVPSFPEQDWKIFRELSEVALDRLCAQILAEIGQLVSDSKKTNHERYLTIFRLIQDYDGLIARAFNNGSRSNAIIQLMVMVKQGIITEEELARFSPSTREIVKER